MTFGPNIFCIFCHVATDKLEKLLIKKALFDGKPLTHCVWWSKLICKCI